mmetsp:Transcript_32339/g.69248  ORF Transcript_32339/g.69248 Transcript_32339/m.69248 type:complete len:563 (-) Transcript_32339:286-1974(-)
MLARKFHRVPEVIQPIDGGPRVGDVGVRRDEAAQGFLHSSKGIQDLHHLSQRDLPLEVIAGEDAEGHDIIRKEVEISEEPQMLGEPHVLPSDSLDQVVVSGQPRVLDPLGTIHGDAERVVSYFHRCMTVVRFHSLAEEAQWQQGSADGVRQEASEQGVGCRDVQQPARTVVEAKRIAGRQSKEYRSEDQQGTEALENRKENAKIGSNEPSDVLLQSLIWVIHSGLPLCVCIAWWEVLQVKSSPDQPTFLQGHREGSSPPDNQHGADIVVVSGGQHIHRGDEQEEQHAAPELPRVPLLDAVPKGALPLVGTPGQEEAEERHRYQEDEEESGEPLHLALEKEVLREWPETIQPVVHGLILNGLSIRLQSRHRLGEVDAGPPSMDCLEDEGKHHNRGHDAPENRRKKRHFLLFLALDISIALLADLLHGPLRGASILLCRTIGSSLSRAACGEFCGCWRGLLKIRIFHLWRDCSTVVCVGLSGGIRLSLCCRWILQNRLVLGWNSWSLCLGVFDSGQGCPWGNPSRVIGDRRGSSGRRGAAHQAARIVAGGPTMGVVVRGLLCLG